jgi:hypothetical protein
MYKHLTIDTAHNKLLASKDIVGIGELVEIYSPDEDTTPQACGRVLRKLSDGKFVVHSACDSNEAVGNVYSLGEFAVLRILGKNRSGTLRRRFSSDEKQIVNLEKAGKFTEKKVIKAKTGSVRKRKA